jgi:hypothetical protein
LNPKQGLSHFGTKSFISRSRVVQDSISLYSNLL